MFSETGAGEHGVFDFWRDVSYGNLDLTGTLGKGWYTAPKTAAEFNIMSRPNQIDICATQADNDVDFSKLLASSSSRTTRISTGRCSAARVRRRSIAPRTGR